MKNVRRILSAFCLLAGSGAAEQGEHFLMVLVLGSLALMLAAPDMEPGIDYETAAGPIEADAANGK